MKGLMMLFVLASLNVGLAKAECYTTFAEEFIGGVMVVHSIVICALPEIESPNPDQEIPGGSQQIMCRGTARILEVKMKSDHESGEIINPTSGTWGNTFTWNLKAYANPSNKWNLTFKWTSQPGVIEAKYLNFENDGLLPKVVGTTREYSDGEALFTYELRGQKQCEDGSWRNYPIIANEIPMKPGGVFLTKDILSASLENSTEIANHMVCQATTFTQEVTTSSSWTWSATLSMSILETAFGIENSSGVKTVHVFPKPAAFTAKWNQEKWKTNYTVCDTRWDLTGAALLKTNRGALHLTSDATFTSVLTACP